MKIIYKYQALSLSIYVLGLLVCLLAMFSFKYLFNYEIPIIGFAIILVVICPLISATTRIVVWIKREKLLTKKEMKNNSTSIYFLCVPVEILFAILSATMLVI